MNKILGLLKNALFTIFDFVTNILAYLLKNVNEIVGIIKTVVKIIVAILHFWKPSADNWVDFVEAWGEKIQVFLFDIVVILNQAGKI